MFINYEPGCSTAMKLFLRRTLVLQQQYAATAKFIPYANVRLRTHLAYMAAKIRFQSKEKCALEYYND